MYVANTDGLCKPLVKKQAEFVLTEFEHLRARRSLSLYHSRRYLPIHPEVTRESWIPRGLAALLVLIAPSSSREESGRILRFFGIL